MKKKYLWILILFVLGLIIFNFSGTLSYTIGGKRGYSSSLQESKERGVFVKELEYEIIPNDLKLNPKVFFFIEKGFRYGSNSIFKTDSLIQVYTPYQLVFSRCEFYCKKFKPCNFDCDNNTYFTSDTYITLENSPSTRKELKNNYLNDTIIYDIIHNISNFQVDTIGKIKVWDK